MSLRSEQALHFVTRFASTPKRLLGWAVSGKLEDERGIVSDLLHRGERGGPVDRAVERYEMIVGPTAIVMDLGQDEMLRHHVDGIEQVAVKVRVAQVETDADIR